MGTGKVSGGLVNKGQTLIVKKADGEVRGRTRVREITVSRGTDRHEVPTASAGDIVTIAYQSGTMPEVTDTLVTDMATPPIPSLPIDAPIVSMGIGPNTSPWAGKDGIALTSVQLRERLEREAVTNVAISVGPSDDPHRLTLSGRGELQMAILIETLRREGYEVSLTKPRVAMWTDVDTGVTMEPWEEVNLIYPQEYFNEVNELIVGHRHGEQLSAEIISKDNSVKATYHLSSRNVLGLFTTLREVTRGSTLMFSELTSPRPQAKRSKVWSAKRCGALVASHAGHTSHFDLVKLAGKGYKIFIPENTPVYPGMIFGECNQPGEHETNPCKGSASKSGVKVRKSMSGGGSGSLTVKQMSIETALSWIQEDEEIEVTPLRVSLRKRLLDSKARKREERKTKNLEY
eukprot:GHVN01052633.1.p1 GENE.GHVN01052633.1~~GHVN01052633.1.p1  ORF type:complete len:403 (-),score=71.70 GHVN01052633.1:962-2170(-)